MAADVSGRHIGGIRGCNTPPALYTTKLNTFAHATSASTKELIVLADAGGRWHTRKWQDDVRHGGGRPCTVLHGCLGVQDPPTADHCHA